MNDPYENMTRDEAVDAGLLEAEWYRDFPPPDEDDPEAYEEMVRQERESEFFEW